MSCQIDSMRIKRRGVSPDVAADAEAMPQYVVAEPFKKCVLLYFAHHPSFKKLPASFQFASSNRFVGSTITCFLASSLIPYRGSDRFAGALSTFPSRLNSDPCFSHFSCP